MSSEEEDRARMFAEQLGLPQVDLTKKRPTVEALAMIPRHFAEARELVPLEILPGPALVVVMADPTDLFAQNELGRITAAQILIAVAPLGQVRAAIAACYPQSS